MGESNISKFESIVAVDSGLVGFALVFALESRQTVAGDREEDAGSNGIDGDTFNSLRKPAWEDKDSQSDMTIGVLGLIVVDVGLTADPGGSGRGYEGGGKIGGKDFLDVIH